MDIFVLKIHLEKEIPSVVKISNISVWPIKNKSISNLLDQSMEHLGLNCADIKSWREVKFQEDWNRERRHDVLHVFNTQSVTRNKSIFDLSIEKRRFCLFFLVMDEIIILVGKKLKLNMRGPLAYSAWVKACQ